MFKINLWYILTQLLKLLSRNLSFKIFFLLPSPAFSRGRKCLVTLSVPKRLTSICFLIWGQVCQSNSPQTHTPALLIRAYKPGIEFKFKRALLRIQNSQCCKGKIGFSYNGKNFIVQLFAWASTINRCCIGAVIGVCHFNVDLHPAVQLLYTTTYCPCLAASWRKSVPQEGLIGSEMIVFIVSSSSLQLCPLSHGRCKGSINVWQKVGKKLLIKTWKVPTARRVSPWQPHSVLCVRCLCVCVCV